MHYPHQFHRNRGPAATVLIDISLSNDYCAIRKLLWATRGQMLLLELVYHPICHTDVNVVGFRDDELHNCVFM